jgi:hypothetical protein
MGVLLGEGREGEEEGEGVGQLGGCYGACAAAGGAGLLLCTCSLLCEFYCFVRRRKPT